MTVNVEALIRSLGKSYQEIVDAGLIPYKTKPTASSGDPDMSLDMAKEGVFLSFKRDGKILQAVELSIQNDKVKNWEFPNELPSPLQKSMSRQWMHEQLGKPDKCSPPEVIMRRALGWTDLFTIEGFHIPISMQILYDLQGMVKSVAFLPTSELRW
ncbi:DUF6392 family protein [Yersinia aleksiciae]|uniref:Pyocin immunity protein n=1 Tax=Yersinia aleksiciae TaxID=263819 RepID=A0A0T9TU22_YERAE|nr:DUF6392 family protein [Yersinia aleksiciae]CNL02133.1 Uncharacterised protein [Yersinia aleksiciae]